MPIGPDISYASGSKIYIKQQPAGTTLNGNTVTTEEVSDVGSCQSQYGINCFNGVVVAQKVTISTTKGAANVVNVTIQAVDNGGNAVASVPFDIDVVLSDAATGVGVTAVTPSGGFAVTTGTLLNTYITSKAFYAQTDATGKVVFTITDTAKTGFYIMVQGQCTTVPVVSSQLTAASYGP